MEGNLCEDGRKRRKGMDNLNEKNRFFYGEKRLRQERKREAKRMTWDNKAHGQVRVPFSVGSSVGWMDSGMFGWMVGWLGV